jgi:Tfp pilus assembly protein PilV
MDRLCDIVYCICPNLLESGTIHQRYSSYDPKTACMIPEHAMAQMHAERQSLLNYGNKMEQIWLAKDFHCFNGTSK